MFNPYNIGGGIVKFATFTVLVTIVIALVAGASLGGVEALNPKRTQLETEKLALENERTRNELTYQDELRQIELEKQRQLAQKEVELYPQLLQRREQVVETVILVGGGALTAGILVVSCIATYYIYQRTRQLQVANQPLHLVGPPGLRRRQRTAKRSESTSPWAA